MDRLEYITGLQLSIWCMLPSELVACMAGALRDLLLDSESMNHIASYTYSSDHEI